MTLFILCIDGMDYDEVLRFGLGLEYNNKLTIPEELHRYGRPFTPNVWPSIFTGRVVIHPLYKQNQIWGPRAKVREFLTRRGITWRRQGFKIFRGEDRQRMDLEKATYTHWPRCVDKTVLDGYNNFTFDIPSVSNTFAMREPKASTEFWVWLSIFANYFNHFDFGIVALYAHKLDGYAHRMMDYSKLYHEVFDLAKRLSKRHKVMIISDHGTVDGEHTLFSYLGCTEPVHATNVLEVKRDIERIME